jgi:hypothetical protein
MVTIAEIISDIRADKWLQRLFIVLSSMFIGIVYTYLNVNNPLGPLVFFTVTTLSIMYLLILFLENHTKKIGSVLGQNSKKMLSNKVFKIWVYSFICWAFLGGLIVTQFHSILFNSVWLYSIIGIVTIYPSLASLMVYHSSFKYLRGTNQEKTKLAIFNSLTFGTVGLASPLVLALLFILAFLSPIISLPVWLYYVIILTTYLGLFSIAIYLPYYQSMEEIKQRVIRNLQFQRQNLIDSINGNNLHLHVAIELNIQRIDRDIQTVASKSSHPYSIMKSMGAFVVVVIIGGMLANLFGEIIKVLLNIG